VGTSAPSPVYRDLFNAVFAQSRTAMLLIDGDRRIVGANRAAAQLTGHAQDALTDLRIDDLYEPRMRSEVPDRFQQAVEHRSFIGRRPLFLAGGGTIPVRYSVTAVSPGVNLGVYEPTLEDGMHQQACDHDDVTPPTRRQREIITHLALGQTLDEIADQLALSPDTVRTHVRNAIKLTAARNRTHLVARALQCGWIVPPS
jgi:PAS domain S-box-containing protein